MVSALIILTFGWESQFDRLPQGRTHRRRLGYVSKRLLISWFLSSILTERNIVLLSHQSQGLLQAEELSIANIRSTRIDSMLDNNKSCSKACRAGQVFEGGIFSKCKQRSVASSCVRLLGKLQLTLGRKEDREVTGRELSGYQSFAVTPLFPSL